MSETSHLNLPLMQAAQAQKHVTHNEALMALDILVQCAVLSRRLAEPPKSVNDGARFLVADNPQGLWQNHRGDLAYFQAGDWLFKKPHSGWLLWVEEEQILQLFTGTQWLVINSNQNLKTEKLTRLGINAEADENNCLAVSGDGILLNHAGHGIQMKLNKNSAADTASLLFQSAYIGCAEIGLAGDNHLSFKTFDGKNWYEALKICQTGQALFPNRPSFYAQSAASPPTLPGPLKYSNVSFNIGNCYDQKLGRFVAPIAGIYRFSGQCLTDQPKTGIVLELHKNGLSLGRSLTVSDPSQYGQSGFTQMLALSRGDAIELVMKSGKKYQANEPIDSFMGELLS